MMLFCEVVYIQQEKIMAYLWVPVQFLCLGGWFSQNIHCTVKLLEESIGEKLHDIEFGGDFLDMTLKANGTKKK